MTTIPRDPPPPAPEAVDRPYPAGATWRSLASAIAVFLGGYLLLLSYSSRFGTVIRNLGSEAVGGPVLELSENEGPLYIAQFVFALAVVVVGLFLGNAPLIRRVIGAVLVVVVALATVAMIGAYYAGALPLSGREVGMVLRALFVNPWFSVVLSVGIAWLLTRRVRLGWLVLLGTAVLAIAPIAFEFSNVVAATRSLTLLAISGILGAAIIAVGRPLRD